VSRGPGKETRLLVEIIEDALNHGAGDLSPELDDLAIEYRRRAGGTLREAHGIIERRIDPAIELLEQDDWFPAKVTEHFVLNYKGQTPNHPRTDVEIARCVAGGGSPDSTYALHFCPKDDCVLVMKKGILNLDSGEKKIQHNLRRLAGVAGQGLLSVDAAETVFLEAGLPKRGDATQVLRIAAKAGAK
jgi:hypothetical protein